jgi:hypothetical protein
VLHEFDDFVNQVLIVGGLNNQHEPHRGALSTQRPSASEKGAVNIRPMDQFRQVGSVKTERFIGDVRNELCTRLEIGIVELLPLASDRKCCSSRRIERRSWWSNHQVSFGVELYLKSTLPFSPLLTDVIDPSRLVSESFVFDVGPIDLACKARKHRGDETPSKQLS